MTCTDTRTRAPRCVFHASCLCTPDSTTPCRFAAPDAVFTVRCAAVAEGCAASASTCRQARPRLLWGTRARARPPSHGCWCVHSWQALFLCEAPLIGSCLLAGTRKSFVERSAHTVHVRLEAREVQPSSVLFPACLLSVCLCCAAAWIYISMRARCLDRLRTHKLRFISTLPMPCFRLLMMPSSLRMQQYMSHTCSMRGSC